MVLCKKRFFTCGFIPLLKGCFLVGEFYLRAVLSDNYSDRVVSFYQAIFEIFDSLLKIGLTRISP